MAIAMFMHWPGVTAETYDAVRRIARWDVNPPTGALFHVAAADASGLRVADVWESADLFQAFSEQRLMPAVKQVGITTEPEVTILPVHFSFAPALTFGVNLI
jgi:hypothetical protein